MQATDFDSHEQPGTRRQVIRRADGEVELVELGWGLDPGEPDAAPRRFVRSEGRTFPTNRCLIPASSFDIRRGERRYRASLEDGNWFYLAGMWRPATDAWPASFAVLTVPANEEVSRYQSRQGAVIRRNRHMAWLDLTRPEAEQLQPLQARSFVIEAVDHDARQSVLAL